jgi:hypothetical protein
MDVVRYLAFDFLHEKTQITTEIVLRMLLSQSHMSCLEAYFRSETCHKGLTRAYPFAQAFWELSSVA